MLPSNQNSSSLHLPFLSNVRYVMILLVVVFHACMTHCNIYAGWFISDSGSHKAFDIYMILSDVFMLPVLFFIAGFFAVPSLNRKGIAGFIKGKFKRLGVPFILCVTLLGPIMMYLHEYQRITWDISISTYLHLWGDYLISPMNLYVGTIHRLEQFRPFHYWFVSMLLIFIIIFSLLSLLSLKFKSITPFKPIFQKATRPELVEGGDLGGFQQVTKKPQMLVL